MSRFLLDYSMRNLTNGLKALTVPEEQAEVMAVGTSARKRRIKFAYWQSDFKGGRIPYWHCDYVNEKEFGTTLSMDGLKQWGKI